MKGRWLSLLLFLVLPACFSPIVGDQAVQPSCDGRCEIEAAAAVDLASDARQLEAASSELDGSAGNLDGEGIDTANGPSDARLLDSQGEVAGFATDSGKRPFDGGIERPPPEAQDATVSYITDAGKRGDGGEVRDATNPQKDSAIPPDVPTSPDARDAGGQPDAPFPGRETQGPEGGPEARYVLPETVKLDVADAASDAAQVPEDSGGDAPASIDSEDPIDTRPATPGRLLVIGHDFTANEPTTDKLLGNAVLLKPADPIELATYEGAASITSVANAKSAIEQVASIRGRTIRWTSAATADDVSAKLATADVLLIYGQENASDGDLAGWAEQWRDALANFLAGGKTIVLLDGYYTGNHGTCQIASLTGLLAIAPRYGATGLTCNIVASTDPVVAGLPSAYVCPRNSVRFAVTESAPNVVTLAAAGNAVATEKLF